MWATCHGSNACGSLCLNHPVLPAIFAAISIVLLALEIACDCSRIISRCRLNPEDE
ncbi:hypothetical protein ACNKHO_22380 [Shigella flexneri]